MLTAPFLSVLVFVLVAVVLLCVLSVGSFCMLCGGFFVLWACFGGLRKGVDFSVETMWAIPGASSFLVCSLFSHAKKTSSVPYAGFLVWALGSPGRLLRLCVAGAFSDSGCAVVYRLVPKFGPPRMAWVR